MNTWKANSVHWTCVWLQRKCVCLLVCLMYILLWSSGWPRRHHFPASVFWVLGLLYTWSYLAIWISLVTCIIGIIISFALRRSKWGEEHESCKHYGWLHESFLGSWNSHLPVTYPIPFSIMPPFSSQAQWHMPGAPAWRRQQKNGNIEAILGDRGKPCLKTSVNHQSPPISAVKSKREIKLLSGFS